MKILKVLMLTLLTFGFLMTMSSCQKSTEPTTDIYSSTEFQLPVTDNTPSDLQDATETSGFMMMPPAGYTNEESQFMGWNGGRGNMDGGMMGDMRNGRGHGPHLGAILRKLNLTQDQIDAIKELMKAHMQCVHDQMLRLRESEKQILQAANAERKAIMQKAKDEGWTRDSLRAALKDLAHRTREALKNNPVRVEVCEAIKLCRQTLLDGIEALLTPEQLPIWQEWRAKLPEIKCGESS